MVYDFTSFFFFFKLLYLFVYLFWPSPQHVEVPGPEIKPKLQQWQHWILNPLSHQGTPKPKVMTPIRNISPPLNPHPSLFLIYLPSQLLLKEKLREGRHDGPWCTDEVLLWDRKTQDVGFSSWECQDPGGWPPCYEHCWGTRPRDLCFP